MPGTIRRIIDRIKDARSGGNSVVALTVETRLVLQGFDPQRFGHDVPDDPARLARIRDIATEMNVDIDDLLAEADVAPDPDAEPGPMPGPPVRSATATREGAASKQPLPGSPSATGYPDAGTAGAAAVNTVPDPEIDDDHPLHPFRAIADEVLAELDGGEAGARSGASFAELMKASLLMGLYSVSNDQALCEQIRYNNLYRWFLGLRPGEGHFDGTAFGEDRQQVLASSAGRAFFDRLVPRAGKRGLFRSDRLQINGRLIKSWMTQERR